MDAGCRRNQERPYPMPVGRNRMIESRATGDDATVAGVPARVVIADDDVLLREGLASLLERSNMEVVGQSGDADHLLTTVREQRPDLVIVDIRMPASYTTESLDAAKQIRAELPETAL